MKNHIFKKPRMNADERRYARCRIFQRRANVMERGLRGSPRMARAIRVGDVNWRNG
ncbi:MAG: hypothetical protein KJ729_08445 [Euryarchaeota archaeon]|nr:hypothetical protein [Euryarchaeota archaeon]